MILTKLHLENFKKYNSYDIEFQEGLVGIIGKNGSGKSTIFEAILFAMFGEAKKRGNKELLRNANASTKDAVVVELEFELDGVEYKVVREFRGKAMTANAKLYKNNTLTTSGAKEVTAGIISLTKMNKDAFMHTLFASQKELTSLSTLKNEDRKKMIRKLLGLEKIDFIEKELVEKSRELKREINAFDEVLLSDEDVKLKQTQIKDNDELKKVELKAKVKSEKELNDLRVKELDAKNKLIIFVKTKENQQKLYSEIQLVKNSITNQNKNQVKTSNELKELEVKDKELKDMSHVKTDFISLEEKLKEQVKLKEYHLKKEGILKEQTSLREQYLKAKEDIKTLENACKMYDKYLADKKVLEDELSTIQTQISAKVQQEQSINANIAGEQRLIDTATTKIQQIQNLGRESECPTCTRQLLDEYDNVISSLHIMVTDTHQKNIDKYNIDLKKEQSLRISFESQKQAKDKIYQELNTQINIIISKQKDLLKAKEYFVEVEKKGVQNKAELKELEKYTYDETTHKQLVKTHEELLPKYKHMQSLETELKRVGDLKIQLQNIVKSIEKLNATCRVKEDEYKLINYDEAKHKEKEKEHTQLQQTKELKAKELSDIEIKIAKIDGEIKVIQTALDTNDTQLKKVQTKKDDLVDYDKIKVSLVEFKTKLNSKIAPRISDIASTMYSQITKGKYQHIEVSNDFDFFIYDDGKKYPIERFSGGEVDLANLVLRIAISKTLTELNGASSIGFLAFDEVFGSQDEARRMEILEAFHTIKEQYRQIFLISHEMEIKEMFEMVVEL